VMALCNLGQHGVYTSDKTDQREFNLDSMSRTSEIARIEENLHAFGELADNGKIFFWWNSTKYREAGY
jgi:hypothetical protein